ncbi:MAG: ATP-binding cassette domain-containing protein [Pseudomonadota bacterium]
MTPVLTCEDLTVTYPDGTTPVNNISFAVEPGTCFALVGGSGAGKTTIAKALMGLHGHGTRTSGKLFLGTKNMSDASAETWRSVRGRDLGFVAQSPWSACDPLRPVRDHVAEAWRCHGLTTSWQEIGTRLTNLGVTDATMRMVQHPHTWSGGMLQRAGIAAAGALTPPLIIADEPTSALDADRAQSVLDSLRALGCAILLISHDIGLVLKNTDKVGVLHRGRIVEQGPPGTLKSAAFHPESKRLLAALSPLPKRNNAERQTPLLRLENVSVHYDRGQVQALDNADLEIRSGEIVGVQGPSGCGKSTLLRIAMGIERPSGGTLWRSEELDRSGATMPIFQDPVASLVPHWPVWRSVAEPLSAPHRQRLKTADLKAKALSAMAMVGLRDVDPDARPSELSVGQCQRVSVARAAITRPPLIVADEPTSALDSPSTWMVSNLLQSAAEAGSAILIVSHDSTLLERLADRIVYMNAGRTLLRVP